VTQNQLPLASGEWILAAMRDRLDEIKENAKTLQTVSEQHRLPEEVRQVCQEMLTGIYYLDSNLSQLETSLDRYRCTE
jgi:uncharacterized protein (UPF0147 family)